MFMNNLDHVLGLYLILYGADKELEKMPTWAHRNSLLNWVL